MNEIKHKIMVMSGKGGVGKTTIAVNLALMLSMKGYEVGLLDADIHGPNTPKMLGIENKKPEITDSSIVPVSVQNLKVMSMAFLLPNTDSPVIWRGPLKMKAISQFANDVAWGKLDYIIVDLPPGTGDEPLSVAQLLKSDGAIVVTTPQDVALLDSRKAINFSKELNVPVIGIIENMSGFICPHCGKEIDLFKKGGGEKASKDMNVPFLGSIPIDTKIVESSDSGTPFILDNGNSKAKKAFEDIVSKVEKFFEKNKKEVI
ncbi:MAG: Mrp/NBP35 family ATP-binding protein [Methanomicrobia archaeon]|nr:Mrp/NBP35 family ATP-binding protein [Methanomicrobia archaeon]